MQLTREVWIKAGLQQLADEGIHKVRIEALARLLKISKGSFYHYFRDRQELLDSMLDYWEIHATKLIVQSMEQQNASLEQLLQISFNRDKKMEIGIYTWAKYDPVVAARLVDMEEQRISCVAKLYQKIGIDENESIDRARLAYLTYIGWMTRFEANPNFDIDKMVELLINDNKCP
ncbi:TetR/AcrR family transcriptional regulator (plasmid) [Cytobacillus solani]|uniref:TetR/AcrR family transcriptional regulator n=1 Tax=Cytobacillus solani TaxID=1637975 RepID=UPI00207A1ED7|nr:TetR/AcrR family transcriptional regulator [Cytobacillus solani]USK57724.1 TetR/AcrR family transcriptional regulator [Cytobacillus solani]